MPLCRICSEKLKKDERIRGTCHTCEMAISKIIAQKVIKSYSYPTKMKFKM